MEICSSSVMPSPIVPLKKGPWSDAEDLLLRIYIEEYGARNWSEVPIGAGLNRCRKSCRLRWLNYLQPNIKRGEFQPDEVDLISRMHNLLGNRWTLIAGRIPGRTANDIKNYCNSHLLKKKLDKLPRPNMSTVENSDHMMETAKVVRPTPQKISETSQSTMNKASTSTRTNINNKLTTRTRFFERVTPKTNDGNITKRSVITSVSNHANNVLTSQTATQTIANNSNNDNSNSALLFGFGNTTNFHVDDGLKLQNENGSSDDYFHIDDGLKLQNENGSSDDYLHIDDQLELQNENGSSDDYFCNFDADHQGMEEHAKVGYNGNCLYNDLYLGDDLWSVL